MAFQSSRLHILFFPLMSHGHMIPILDMAKLLVSRGVTATIVTTPLNAPHFSTTTKNIHIKTIPFPSTQVGLPPGLENLDSVETHDVIKFLRAISMLQAPFEEVLRDLRPDCIVSDTFFSWTTDVAAIFKIPRLVFHGTSFFSLCVLVTLGVYKPYLSVESDSEPFVVPNLPSEITFTRMQLPDMLKENKKTEFTEFIDEMTKSDQRSYGTIVNSFYEVEPAYADHYRRVLGRKAWHIGPVSLCNRNIEDKARRGKPTSIDEHECLKWLDSKTPRSVVYVCFGSITNFALAQLMEIAVGLEACGHDFIWVVRRSKEVEATEEWLPNGYEKRMEGKGLIIRGWAPQVLILDHVAIGAFVTHCGWNSTLEGVSAGVPMVTWPMFAEQFYNEKLVTEVLRIGVSVGAKKWVRTLGDSVNREAVEAAVNRVMVGEEAEEMKSRAEILGEIARKAGEEGGSSYSELGSLIEELKLFKESIITTI